MRGKQVPQRKPKGESKQACARRLRSAHPQLTLHEICQLSGVMECHLKQDPAFWEFPAHLAPIRAQIPQIKGEKNQVYARRLRNECSQLTLFELSLLSGVKESDLKRDPALRPLPAYLAPIRAQIPQDDRESKLAYARRLHIERPRLTVHEISLLSGVMESHLKQDRAFWELPAHLAPIRAQGSASSRSRGPKRTAIEAAAAQPGSQEGLAIRSVRPRLTDERGRQHPPNMQPAPVQAAGTDGSQLQELLAYLHQELLSSTPPSPEAPASTPGMEQQREFAHMLGEWERLTDAPANRFASRSGLTDLFTPASAEDAEIGTMIDELLQQPGELLFMAQPQAPGSRGQTIGTEPAAMVAMPARTLPSALLLQVPQQNIEAAIAVMRRNRLGREAAEHAVGLPAGVLAAVVDAQGNWLNEPALSDIVASLSPEQVQTFAMKLQQMRTNLRQLGPFE
ncbi:MAG: hypothetical protein JF606_22950 [Burkholderiales bacterium]|nr:hypothetical protein [Burkholderiales bacterium]